MNFTQTYDPLGSPLLSTLFAALPVLALFFLLVVRRAAVPLAAAGESVRARVPGEMVRARLCQEPDRLIYLLTVLPRDGKVRRVIVDAKNGAVVSVR